jgi:PKHD-type hydroxylase
MSDTFHHIPALLKPGEIQEIQSLSASSSFIDGKSTASLAAKDVKQNLQLDPGESPASGRIQEILSNALSTSPYFQAAAQPKKIHPFIISKYGPGQYYGWHVDSPIMGDPPLRTDLAMTIFLNDPSSYDGGELVLQTATGVIPFKVPAGDAILYPCQYLHCVQETTRGERLAAVTWVQSNIPSTEKRTLLFQLNQAHALLHRKEPQAPETQLLLQAYSNLFRMWADV